jgi:hypothetical protein
MKEALGQVFGLLVATACAAEVAIDGLPVSLQEQADQRLLGVLLLFDALDQGPVGGQKGFCRPAHVCLIVKSHGIYSSTHNITPSGGSLYRQSLEYEIFSQKI